MDIITEYWATFLDGELLGTIWCDEGDNISHADHGLGNRCHTLGQWLDEMNGIAQEDGAIVLVYALSHTCGAALSIDCECGQYAISHLPEYTYAPPGVTLA